MFSGKAEEICTAEASLEEDTEVRKHNETIEGTASYKGRLWPEEEARRLGTANVKSHRVQLQIEGRTFEQ